ncbi:ATPase PAAT [Lissotriton helveticus]
MESGMPVTVSVSCGSPWTCVSALSSVLRVRRGPEEVGCESDDLVLLARAADEEDENSCCLFIECDPRSGEEIISLLLESQARTIEVYAEEEYLGTSRGEVVCTVPSSSSDEVVTLYRTSLKLESSEPVCKVKLLSLGGRLQVLIKAISVGVTAARPRRLQNFPTPDIDLECVRSLVEGSQLSSGAQQLMSMVQNQQRNHFPFGEQLLCFLRKPDMPAPGGLRQVDGLNIPSDFGSSHRSFACKSGLTGSQLYQDSGTASSASEPGAKTLIHGDSLTPRGDFKEIVSSFIQRSAAKDTDMSSHNLLPFLHSLCGEMNHLRIEEQGQESQRSQSEKSATRVERDYSGTCLFLEDLITKQMGAMEKRLLDHIDNRINRLQEQMDARMGLLVNLLQNSHITSGERKTNGEVHILSDM